MRLGVHHSSPSCDALFWLSPSCCNIWPYCYSNLNITQTSVMAKEKLTSSFSCEATKPLLPGLYAFLSFAHCQVYLCLYLPKQVLVLLLSAWCSWANNLTVDKGTKSYLDHRKEDLIPRFFLAQCYKENNIFPCNTMKTWIDVFLTQHLKTHMWCLHEWTTEIKTNQPQQQTEEPFTTKGKKENIKPTWVSSSN